MKKYILVPILLSIAIFASACGSPSTPATEAATELPTQPPATTESTQPSPAGSSTQVTITLADNTIDASQTTFQVGVPYTFVINNEGRHAHNFNISTPVSEAGSLDAALEGALLGVSRDQLAAGASVTVDFIFPDSAAGQNLEFSCLIKRHYEDHMLLPITVTK